MPKRAVIATKEYLQQVPLPVHANSYTVISHETVIANTLEQLKLKGFEVETETYRCNSSGEVAVGVYQLKYKNDPELGMMFAWANSYDKTMRFKCAVGGFVRISDSSIISGDFSWGRKHTGTADHEMIATIKDQITNGQIYYDGIVAVKEQMKQNHMTREEISAFLGTAFFKRGLFSKEQIGIVRDELIKPSYDYNAPLDSLWTYYNHMLVSLKKANPRTWMDEQRELHNYVCEYFNIQIPKAVTEFPLTGTGNGQASISEGDPTVTTGSTGHTTPTSEDEINISSTTAARFSGGGDITYEVTPEEQKQIDAAIASLDKIEIATPSLNLPD